MCVMSAVHDQYRPWIPNPGQWPEQPPKAPQSPIPSVTIDPNSISPEDLKKLIESFHKAVEAAAVFDELTGQPDCVDPDKAKLIERIEALEAKIAELESE